MYSHVKRKCVVFCCHPAQAQRQSSSDNNGDKEYSLNLEPNASAPEWDIVKDGWDQWEEEEGGICKSGFCVTPYASQVGAVTLIVTAPAHCVVAKGIAMQHCQLLSRRIVPSKTNLRRP